MADKINPLILSYPQFTLGEVIDPEHANQNNYDIANKVNEFINDVELTRQMVEDAQEDAANAITIAITKGDIAINAASAAVSTANTADGKADTAISTANTADGKADTAISTANTALGQDTVEPYTGALGAMKIATDVQADYEIQKPIIEQAVIDAQAAVDAVALKADVSYVDSVAASFVLGTVPDGTITDSKLSNTAGQIKPRVSVIENSIGTANGIATLDATGNVPVGQLGNVPASEVPFDFDNFYGRQGHTYKTEKDVPSAGSIRTSIINTSTEAVVATMTTEKDTPTAGQIRTTLYVAEDNITATKTLSIDGSGNIVEVIS